ncbi:MAG: glycosyl transferase [Bacteroidales bacterium]|nr:glycosyl transferase [Bacteroidales bacterium]
MLYFSTLFDSFYLSRGLVMYESLKQHTNNFHFYIFAFDDLAYEILISLNLENVTIISLSEFENQKLLNIKNTRTKAEYCWTCTPSTIDYVIETYNIPSCTYLDADLFFYQSPAVLLEEMNKQKTVLITEHRFSKVAKINEQERAGRFCVQFITFTKDQESKEVLNRWKNQCIDWCYARYEDGKFGDQKYLDEWPERYNNIQILENLGGGVALWNIQQYKIIQNGNSLFGIDKKSKKKFEIIFYHFHYVRFLKHDLVDIGWNYLPKFVISKLYKPYISKIIETEKKLEQLNKKYKTVLFNNKPKGLKENAKALIKSFTKFNLIKAKD